MNLGPSWESSEPWTVVDVSADGHTLKLSVNGSVCTNEDLSMEPGSEDFVSRDSVVRYEESRTRVVNTILDESDQAVEIAVWVEQPPPESGACVGGEEVKLPVEVTLDEPLGQRPVVDGGVVPPTPVDLLLEAAEA